jgi:hypothetical protein
VPRVAKLKDYTNIEVAVRPTPSKSETRSEPAIVDVKEATLKANAEVKLAHEAELKRMKVAFKRELSILIANELKNAEKE